jgi:hypothetical protein
MVNPGLKQRIERYKETYLDTPNGRDHYQTVLDEHLEVQNVYQQLQDKYQAGEDITDETLSRLLPHAKTQNNESRGARISTWPCITKDIVTWFEGAKWKTSDDWPTTAEWLLAIVEAGYTQNWDVWYELVDHPVKKGFATGFISPIIHCLNPDLPVVNSKVVKTYYQTAEQLGLNTQITARLIDYPEHSSPFVMKLVELLQPYGINDYVEWDIYCHWNISKRLGGAITSQPTLDYSPRDQIPEIVSTELAVDGIAELCALLKQSQHDSANYEQFEMTIAQAFEILGFDVDHIGGAGNADVVIKAALGEDSFSAVIDAKSKKEGGSYAAPSGYAQIKNHQEENATTYAIVIAPDFAGGNTVSFAEKEGIGLMTTNDLINLLEAHAESPLSLYYVKSLFEGQVGRINLTMDNEHVLRLQRILAARTVLNVFDNLQRDEEGNFPSLTVNEIFAHVYNEHRLTKEFIADAIDFLGNPLVGILERRHDGFVLTIPAKLAAGRLAAIANVFSR